MASNCIIFNEAFSFGLHVWRGGAFLHRSYLWPAVFDILDNEKPPEGPVFDLGCGNGAFAAALSERGYEVAGVDPSEEGIQQARTSHPGLELEVGSTHDDLAGRFGTFPVVVSLEVVEHVYDPYQYAQCIFDLLEEGGVALLSTPYHSYFKNLALALLGKIGTSHYNPLWQHGHIKIWTPETLRQLLEETGFHNIRFRRVGRIPPLAKSMIAIAEKSDH